MRSVCQHPSVEQIHSQHKRAVAQLEERFSHAASKLDEAGADVLAFTSIPMELRKKIWSNDPRERLSKEMRRRIGTVGMFPNLSATLRLCFDAVLAEESDKWVVGI